jgi:predicted ATP-binding protein involved in virulence
MHFNQITLTNYRCHAKLTLDLDRHFNVLVGINGSGKTSALLAISTLIEVARGQLRYPVTDVRQVIQQENGRVFIETCLPSLVEIAGELQGTPFCWTSGLNDQGVTAGNAPSSFAVERNPVGLLPVLAFYPASRRWNGLVEQYTFQGPELRNASYGDWKDASGSVGSLQTWVASKCMERFQQSSETGVLFDEITGDDLDVVNSALKQAIPGIQGLRFDFKLAKLLLSLDQHTLMFDSLSDGQKGVVCLIADITRRMCLLNPQLGAQVTQQTPGVVLIDELDLHLHPGWQRSLTHGLKLAFPQVQFIVTSHSPQILGELQPSEIILLQGEGISHPEVSYGLDASRVLEDVMETDSRNRDIERELALLFESIEKNDLVVAKERLGKLRQQAPGLAELDRAEAWVNRRQILGR